MCKVLTKKGLEKIQAELKDLKENKRKDIRERIKTAKEYGDLSENSEYSDAKEQQAFIEGRIQELENLIKKVKVVDKKKNITHVSVGDKVTLQIEGDKEVYEVVGVNESDPASGKISCESPIAESLLDHKVGDIVEFPTPDGKMDCKILKIE
jgi:transcription elongation factor GreA